MRNESHGTLIGAIKQHVVEWRKGMGWSRETVAQVIVESHERISGPDATGIRFEAKTTDPFERQKVNADRIFRWLDDDTKDTNFLPANFIPSILAAMPIDRRLACVDEMLRPLQLACRRMDEAEHDPLNVQGSLVEIIKEDAESQQALASLLVNPTASAIDSALREINEAIETKTAVRGDLEAERDRRAGQAGCGAV